MSEPLTRTYRIVTAESIDEMSAAYFVHEDDFTIFKTSDGSIVGSFRNEHLVSITTD